MTIFKNKDFFLSTLIDIKVKWRLIIESDLSSTIDRRANNEFIFKQAVASIVFSSLSLDMKNKKINSLCSRVELDFKERYEQQVDHLSLIGYCDIMRNKKREEVDLFLSVLKEYIPTYDAIIVGCFLTACERDLRQGIRKNESLYKKNNKNENSFRLSLFNDEKRSFSYWRESEKEALLDKVVQDNYIYIEKGFIEKAAHVLANPHYSILLQLHNTLEDLLPHYMEKITAKEERTSLRQMINEPAHEVRKNKLFKV